MNDEDRADGEESSPDPAEPDAGTDRLVRASDPLSATLPPDLAAALGAFVGRDPVETLGEWAAVVRRRTGGGSISLADLCHADRETPHWGDHDGERYYFECFYDAVIVAALADGPVDVRTESPAGTVVRATAMGSDHLRASPAAAVFSVGIDPAAARASDGEPTPADVYAAHCPSVRAFPDAGAYDRWDADVSAVTVALPLSGATDLAAALVAD